MSKMMSRRRVLAWERRKAAVHEAGHVVIGRILGVTRIDANIFSQTDALPNEKTWGGQTRWSGHYIELSITEQPWTRRATKQMRRMIAVAGSVAELCWSRANVCFVLDHRVIHGDINDDFTWREMDQLLRARFPHPHGGNLKIDACAIDAGDGGHLDHVMNFCRPRASRRVMAIKGMAWFSRPPLLASRSKMCGGGRLWIVGSDAIKSGLFNKLSRDTGIRFSKKLSAVFYEQLASERAVTRVLGGKPVRRFGA